MGILSDFVTNLQYYYLAYKKTKNIKNLFHIHTCDCEDCEGCNCEDGCVQVETDSTDDINKAISRIRYLIMDDREDELDCMEEVDYEDCTD